MHFPVVVVGENWEEQLQPYDENLKVEPSPDETPCWCSAKIGQPDPNCEICGGTGIERINPRAKWDFYNDGGRWVDYFALKPGKDAEMASQARKSDIDFAATKRKRRETAETRWQAFSKEKRFEKKLCRFLRLRPATYRRRLRQVMSDYAVRAYDSQEGYLHRNSLIAPVGDPLQWAMA